MLRYSRPSVQRSSPDVTSGRYYHYAKQLNNNYRKAGLPKDIIRLRKHMAKIPDPVVMETFGKTFGLEVPSVGISEGLCVTGDTILPVVSAKGGENGDSPFKALEGQSPFSLKPIIKVMPGDYVLSLNEETQRIEPHRINFQRKCGASCGGNFKFPP